MQTKIMLDPSYRGPMIVEEQIRKMKSQSSLGRMISTFNKRFFVLDFKRMICYYLPEKGSQLSSAKHMQLETVTRIYVDKQLQMLDDHSIWKHGFVILCGKRSYKLISHSQNNMENLLYAFAHIINTETKKPLFDWNEYKATVQQQPTHSEHFGSPQPQVFSPTEPMAEQKTNSDASLNYAKPPIAKKKSSEERRSNDSESDIPKLPGKDARTMSSDKGRQEAGENSAPPRREETLVVKKENSQRSNEDSDQGLVARKKLSSEGTNEGQTPMTKLPYQKVSAKEVDSVDMCESKVIMPNESVHVNASENHQNGCPAPEEKRVEPLRNRLEVLSIDPVENSVPRTNSHPSSTKGRISINRRPMHVDSPKNNVWSDSPKSNFASQLQLTSSKSIGEAYYTRKDDSNSMQQNDQDQRNEWDTSSKAKQVKPVEDDGWGIVSPAVKKENINNFEKKSQNHDDWDQDAENPPKKNYTSNVTKAQTNTVKNVADDDDDWDKEMFGDEDDKKPQKNKFEIRADAKYTNQTSSYSSDVTGFGKPTRTAESSYKQNDVVIAKPKVHNDWDDDL